MSEIVERDLSIDEAAALAAGDQHYRAYVGPPERYDLIGASQFALLFLLGLRESHHLLDFGCGSLRLGRLAIPYLRADRYFGVEPEAWLVDQGFERELGMEARALKRPRFDFNSAYRTDAFGEKFDFIIAQSVLSHTGQEPARRALAAFADSLAPDGLIVVNWLVGEETETCPPETEDWVYPGCVTFSLDRIGRLAAEVGLAVRRCPWPHPGLSWFVMAKNEERLERLGDLARFALPPPAWVPA